jgi:hypothetical protein
MWRSGQVYKMVSIIVTKNRRSIGVHILIGVTDQLNARLGCDQFPEMEAGAVLEKHIAAQETFGKCALLGVNIL